ncbi:MAG: hypothetical protein KJZ98_02875 [Burkholderiaceae bacterium]|nr:hypothetical protein [Burkholderiaceae bacterium]MEB2351509.1 hypothetical protein [Burkholderiaceae bacterium]
MSLQLRVQRRLRIDEFVEYGPDTACAQFGLRRAVAVARTEQDRHLGPQRRDGARQFGAGQTWHRRAPDTLSSTASAASPP